MENECGHIMLGSCLVEMYLGQDAARSQALREVNHMLISIVQSQICGSKKPANLHLAVSLSHLNFKKKKQCKCPLCLFYFNFHYLFLFNEVRNLLGFYHLVFVLPVDGSCMMVLLLDAKKRKEKKNCILPECTEYDNVQTEQPKLYFVNNVCITPIFQKLSISYKVAHLNRKNMSLCYSDCDNPRTLWRLLCHMVTNCFKAPEMLDHKQRIGESSPSV